MTQSINDSKLAKLIDKAKVVDFCNLIRETNREYDIVLNTVAPTDKPCLVKSGDRFQLWVLRNDIAYPVLQRRGSSFVVTV
ncbi:hypothetical protein JQC92_07140 [Shewanella sp. 202IG2-18]|uniref:hypothetical protein n=1 Tax=Parashewanella hymeniacidonis TaxID=2807618 RepID=UPI00195F55A7|nr:hypothetical protein [Parashewanella hymeniacidonis]MBM7071817.1 hypothetical protein [Parashewanella hymeniacidonis]